jgi:hypothetical protein
MFPKLRARLLAAAVALLVLLVPTAAHADAGHHKPRGFVHPGVLVSHSQLEFVRWMVLLKQQPWKGAFDQMLANPMAAADRVPKPFVLVECGSFSNPNIGCTEERQDALAAYANALAWYITKDRKYANKAIELMDAWSATITGHLQSNGPLQTGWAGSSWPRAAEIIRYTYHGWKKSSVERFEKMLREVYLPVVIQGHATNNGNWETTMLEAAIGIAVFLDDRASYDTAIAKFRARVPAYVYLTSDGPAPPAPAGTNWDAARVIRHWSNQSTFVDGLSQETCRDFVHTGYGLVNMAHIAETTRIQRDSLWPELRERMTKTLEFHANYELGAPVPAWLCGGVVKKGLGPITEVAYNALHNRMGVKLPLTKQIMEQRRPADSNYLFIGWDTLTHANNLF